MKKALLILSASSLLLLQGCGGGGSDSDTSAPNSGGGNTNTTAPGNNGSGNTTTPPSNNGGGNTGTGGNGSGGADQGSVSVPFVRGDASRYVLVSPLGQNMGVLSSSAQDASGGMTTLNTTQITGGSIQDIAGDASFAIGRWAKGTVTTASGADTLTGTDGRAYHYIAYQGLSALPNSALHCQGGSFTSPTYTGGGSKAALIGSSVSGTVDIGSNGAFSGTLAVSANGETANLALPNSLSSSPVG